MAKPLLLSSGSGKVQEFVGTATGQLPTWSQSAQEWVLGTNGGSGGGGAIFYLNSAAAADTPTTNVPGGTGGATAYFTPAQLSQTFNATASTRLSPPTGHLPSNGSWAIVQGILSDDALGLTALPPGLWDFNIWAKASTGAGPSQVEFRVRVGVYADSTNTLTYLFDSDSIFIYDPTVAAQYPASVVIGSNTIAATDRLYVEVNARSSVNNRTATFYFGGDTPSHVHTTIEVPVNLATGVTGTLPVANGGTGATTASANTVFAAPNGSSGNPAFRALVAADIPSLSGDYLPLTGGTLTGKLITLASTTTTAGLNLPHGTAPTSPVNGDVWTTSDGLFARISGFNQQFGALSIGNTWTNNNTFSSQTNSFGTSAATGTTSLATGATVSGATKTVNIGMNGAAGSSTFITIGTAIGASTTTLNGTVSATTAAVDTNTTQVATTAYVVGQGYAKLASPAFTGTPSLPTGTTGVTQSAGNNTTALATTAFVTTAVASSSGAPYDVAGEYIGKPPVSTVLMRFVSNRSWTLKRTLVQASCTTFPTGSNAVATISVASTPIASGTITWATTGSTVTIGAFADTLISSGQAVVLTVTTADSNNVFENPFFTLGGVVA